MEDKIPQSAIDSIAMKAGREGIFPFGRITKDTLPTAACTDLGAFRKPLQKIADIGTLVIMEDRSPEFFLSFQKYEPKRIVPLNRHGPLQRHTTQEDLYLLAEGLHNQGKKIVIGFWGFWGDSIRKPTDWLKSHPELRPRQKDESDIGNPFSVLFPENITFAEHVAKQYEKLHGVFGFDGLFLGDGLSGYRHFLDPVRYRNKEDSYRQWAEFYRVIAEVVHRTGGKLWAYDCMGFSHKEARLHGVDYNLLAKAGLDVLVFQSYPTAWVRYFKVSGKTGLDQDLANFKSVKQEMKDTDTKLYYSLELGDSVEGWWPKHKTTCAQIEAFTSIADGKLLVWGNELISSL